MAGGDEKHDIIDEKVRNVIRMREANKGTLIPFNRILLKFPMLRRSFGAIRKVFSASDKDGNGTIEHSELVTTMKSLGAELSEEEVLEVFAASDVYQEGKLNFREFLVCLGIGYILGKIPVLSDGDVVSAPTVEVKKLGAAELESSLSAGDGRALAYAFHLALDAYMYFDTDLSGTIDRKELLESMESLAGEGQGMAKKHTNSAAMSFLTDERFAELDFDHDGECTFKEFLHAFVNWVGVDDDDEDE